MLKKLLESRQLDIFMSHKVFYLLLLFISSNLAIFAQTKTADPNNTDQIITWVNDGSTKKIIFPAGTYNFSKSITITNNELELKGSGKESTIINLASNKNSLIDAKGNNLHVEDLTLDGNNKQRGYGNTIFLFDKSKGHRFENVLFTNSLRDAINSARAYATDGLVLKNCVFSNIKETVIRIFNRTTPLRGGEVITSVDKILLDSCVFKEGYATGISSDNGNDREDSGDGTGRRYTESTSLNGTTIQNCTFEKCKKFHIGMVQTQDVIFKNNIFKGMTDDAGGGCQAMHFEQFTHNIEIYDNIFSMANTLSKPCMYIHFAGTEGHKRVTQERPSSTYKTWTYKVHGSNERRASREYATTGNINKNGKRDVHAYGARNIYIAGNTFNASTDIKLFLDVIEGENIQFGTKKDGTISLNHFLGGDKNTKKLSFAGHDEGTGNVKIIAGQGILRTNIDIKDVSFDLPPIRLKKPIVVE